MLRPSSYFRHMIPGFCSKPKLPNHGGCSESVASTISDFLADQDCIQPDDEEDILCSDESTESSSPEVETEVVVSTASSD